MTEVNKQSPAPKLFISYSWSSATHEEWVLELATELRQSGIDVIFDKWDLREGHDANAFMEQMVSDPSLDKVVMICDQVYASKANKRAGGVGTEAQIISKEVYAKQDQTKFVAVVREKDADGNPCVPAYYASRIFIDLSEDEKYASEYDKLIRWVFNKPINQKPPIGKMPSYLADEKAVTLGTSAAARHAIDAIKSEKKHASAALEDYFGDVVSSFERLRIELTGGDVEFDEMIHASIENSLPIRTELLQVFTVVSRYGDAEYGEQTHKFFEQLLPYSDRPESMKQWHPWGADNFRFITHELFLYALALFIKANKFELANTLLERQYFSESAVDRVEPLKTFTTMHRSVESLEHRNRRLGLKRLSLQSDMLKERCQHSGIDFSSLMQADFVAFLRADHDGRYWWPETLLYASYRYSGAFEIFARAISSRYFDRVKVLLGITTLGELNEQFEKYKTRESIPRWQMNTFDPAALTGYDSLCSKP